MCVGMVCPLLELLKGACYAVTMRPRDRWVRRSGMACRLLLGEGSTLPWR